MKLARKGQELQTYDDMIKDPYVLEFTGLSPQSKLYESRLELGKGIAAKNMNRRSGYGVWRRIQDI